jgi:hypothetical protein
MKYLSLVIVIAFICFTFWFSKRSEELTIDQMNKINNLITAYMTQAVQNNQPNATEIEFSKIYTEVIESGKEMKAHFKFSYMEPNADGEMEKVYRRGTFLITSKDGNKWTAQIENAGDLKVEFMEPFEITEEGEVEQVDEPASEEETTDSQDDPDEVE